MFSKLAVFVGSFVVLSASGTDSLGFSLLQTNAAAQSVSSRSSSASLSGSASLAGSASASEAYLAAQLARVARSLKTLVKDARSAVAEQYLNGETAPLNQKGYEMSLGRAPMRTFAQRVVDEEGMQLLSLVDFHEFLKYFDGTCQKQSYASLVEELHSYTKPGKCHSAWIKSKASPISLKQMSGIKALQKELQDEKEEMAGAVAAKKLSSMQFQRSDIAMQAFITEVVNNLHGNIFNNESLHEFVLVFSSNQKKRPFRGLMSELHSISDSERAWLHVPRFEFNASSFMATSEPEAISKELKSAGIGDTAALSEEGYASVLAAIEGEEATTAEMCTFVNRTLRNEGLTLINNNGLLGFCPWYSGECSQESYFAMVSELHVAVERPEECGGGWVADEIEADEE